MPAKLSQVEFIKLCSEKHNNFYNYSKTIYTGSNNKITITCPVHGDFEQKAKTHKEGFKCSKCMADSYKLTQDQFIEKANIKHENYFDYSKTIYTKGDNEITIICPLHGDFKQLARKHLEGRGCVKCSRTKVSLKLSKENNTFLREGFINKSKNNLATLYIIQCFNETESFYKIGITTKTVKERYNSSHGMPYLYKIIEEVHGDAGTIYDLEVKLKNQMASYHIVPAIKFNGCKTECFSNFPLLTTPLDVNKNKSVLG